MKRIMLFLCAIVVAMMPLTSRAQSSLTVAEGTEYPYYGFNCYADWLALIQCVYPASMLTDLEGTEIISLTWHTDNVPEELIPNVAVRLTEVNQTSAESYTNISSVAPVYTGNFYSTTNEITLVLNEPYLYQGGNLLVELKSNQTSEWDCSYNLLGMDYDDGHYMRYDDEGYPESEYDDVLLTLTFGYQPVGDCPAPSGVHVVDVTANEATLCWVGNEAADEYTIYLDGEEYDVVQADTFYTFTDLDAATLHTASVSATCGDEQTGLRSTTFRTLCAAVALPWVDDFESYEEYAQPDCWTMIRSFFDDEYYPLVDPDPTYARESVGYLYIWSDGDSTVFTTPMFDHPGNDIEVEFYAKVYSGGVMKVGIMTNPNDPSTFVEFLAVSNADGNNTPVYQSYYFNTSILESDDPICIAFRTWEGIDLDDIAVNSIPTCARPLPISISDITDNGATFEWSGEADSYVLRITSNSLDTLIDGITTTQYTADELPSRTTYMVYAASVCGGDTTSFTMLGTFRTPCVALTADDLPYSEDFNNYSAGTSSAIDPCWTKFTQYGTSYPYPSTSYNHGGGQGNSLYFYAGDQSRYNYAVMPLVESLDGLMVSFWVYTSSPTSAAIQVGTMTDPDDATTFTPLFTTPSTLPSSTWTEFEVPFTSGLEAQYVAFRNQGTAYYAIYLDDITLLEATSCIKPLAVDVSDIQAYEATLHIVDPTEVGHYEVTVTLDGQSTTYELESIADTVYTLTDLQAASSYTVSVASICDDGAHTGIITTTFRTPCAPISTFPWTEDFNNLPTSGSITTEEYLACWEQATGDYIDATTPVNLVASQYSFAAVTYAMSGSLNVRCNIYGSSSTNKRWLITPSFAIGDEGSLEFDYALTGYNTSAAATSVDTDDVFRVLVSTDGGITYASLYSWGTRADCDALLSAVPATTSHLVLDLTPYAGQTVRFAFYGESTISGSDNDFHIDNLVISAEAGEQPQPVQHFDVSVATANAQMGSASCTPSGSVAEGTSVTATATANQGYLFVNWTDAAGSVVSTANPYTFVVNADVEFYANFEAEPSQGISDVDAANVSLLPNPTTSMVRVGFEGKATIELIDLNGKQLLRTEATDEATLDVSRLARGTYFVRVSSDSLSAVRKLVVK